MPDRPDSAQTFRVGRLRLDLPASASVTPTTNGGTYNFAPIEEVPWPAGLPETGRERDAARAAYWGGRLAEAERRAAGERDDARYNRKPADAIVVTERAVAVEGAGWARALSWPDDNLSMTTVVVVADFGPILLVSLDRASTERTVLAIDIAVDAFGGYVPASAPGFGGPGLYLRYGLLPKPPPMHNGKPKLEGASARFNGVPPFADWDGAYDEGLAVSMSTRLSPPDGPSLLERWRETQGVGLGRLFRGLVRPAAAPEAREVRAGAKAAGPAGTLAGGEVVSEFRMEAEAGPNGERVAGGSLHFEWEHTGTPGDGRDPNVYVSAATAVGAPASRAERAAALSAWDAVLASVRTVP